MTGPSVKVSPMTAPWRAVGLFVLLTTCLSGIFWVLINATRPSTRLHLRVDVDDGGGRDSHLPHVGRPLRRLGMGNGRYVLVGYLIPIAYCLMASLAAWWHR